MASLSVRAATITLPPGENRMAVESDGFRFGFEDGAGNPLAPMVGVVFDVDAKTVGLGPDAYTMTVNAAGPATFHYLLGDMPAMYTAASWVVDDPALKQRLEKLTVASIDHVFGRNPILHAAPSHPVSCWWMRGARESMG